MSEEKTIERKMADSERAELKNQIADKTMELERLKEEFSALSGPYKDVMKRLQLEVKELSLEVKRGTVTERNPDYVGRSD